MGKKCEELWLATMFDWCNECACLFWNLVWSAGRVKKVCFFQLD